MRIELLYVPNCPNHAPTAQILRDALHDLGVSEEVIEIEVCDPAQAAAVSFPGSPTIRINGRDVEPGMPESGHHGLSCRTYLVHGKRQGIPRREWISQAVLSVAEDAGGI